MNSKKISLFKDKPDYIKVITNDNIYNITGLKKSGKTPYTRNKSKDNLVIHLKSVFNKNSNRKNTPSKKLQEYILFKYGNNLNPKDYFEARYYDTIIEYVNNQDKPSYIEGDYIYNIINLSKLKGTIIIKRTSTVTCLKRIIKIENLTNIIYIIKELFYLIKESKKINIFISNLEEYDVR